MNNLLRLSAIALLVLVLLGLGGKNGIFADDDTISGSSINLKERLTAKAQSSSRSDFIPAAFDIVNSVFVDKSPENIKVTKASPLKANLDGVEVEIILPANAQAKTVFDFSIKLTTLTFSYIRPLLAVNDNFTLNNYEINGVSPFFPSSDFTYTNTPFTYNYNAPLPNPVFRWNQVPLAYQTGYKFVDLGANVPWQHAGYISEWSGDNVTWTFKNVYPMSNGDFKFAVFVDGRWITADWNDIIIGFVPVDDTLTVSGGVVVPAAPSNLIATAVSSSQINLAWQDNSDNEDGFIIERYAGWESVYEQIATVNANITTYPNAYLSDYTLYTYRIKAFNQAGNSEFSNVAIASTLAYIPTIGEMKGLLNQYYQAGLIKNKGIYTSFLANFNCAYDALLKGDILAAINQLQALRNKIEEQIAALIAKGIEEGVEQLKLLRTYVERFLNTILSPAQWEWTTPLPPPAPPWIIKRDANNLTILTGNDKSKTSTDLKPTNTFKYNCCLSIQFFEEKLDPENEIGVMKYSKALELWGYGKPVVIQIIPHGNEGCHCECKEWGFVQMLKMTTHIKQTNNNNWEEVETMIDGTTVQATHDWKIESTPTEQLKEAANELIKQGALTNEQAEEIIK
ncbi:MAG: fibronectin type III domain-containing protein [Planctomycetes bacterium]|nr:fibronectin type III domain-containing protein [Planctomycetota bacterium]